MNLLIRDVPDDVRRALAERAARRGQSMQAYLVDLITTDARRNVNIPLLAAVRAGGGGIDEPADDPGADLRELRASREEQLSGSGDPA